MPNIDVSLAHLLPGPTFNSQWLSKVTVCHISLYFTFPATRLFYVNTCLILQLVIQFLASYPHRALSVPSFPQLSKHLLRIYLLKSTEHLLMLHFALPLIYCLLIKDKPRSSLILRVLWREGQPWILILAPKPNNLVIWYLSSDCMSLDFRFLNIKRRVLINDLYLFGPFG